jgi:hypothetical protein
MNEEDFRTIITGNGFQNDLMATINDRIKKQVIATNELHNAITSLNKSIKSFNKEASEQTKKVIKLNKWVVYLTLALVVGLVVQIIIAIAD